MFIVLNDAKTREEIAININQISHAVRHSKARVTYIYEKGEPAFTWIVKETPSRIVNKIKECTTCNA